MAGDFGDGIVLWTGFGADVVAIDGTHRRDDVRTITTLNTGLGDDTVGVRLTDGEDGFFVLNTQGPHEDQPGASDKDTVDASASTLPLIIFGGQDDDQITGGSADDIILGDRGRVHYRVGGTAAVVLGGGGPADLSDARILTVNEAFTVDPRIGGHDVLQSESGADALIGGSGDDRITLGGAISVILGDNGRILSRAMSLFRQRVRSVRVATIRLRRAVAAVFSRHRERQEIMCWVTMGRCGSGKVCDPRTRRAAMTAFRPVPDQMRSLAAAATTAY